MRTPRSLLVLLTFSLLSACGGDTADSEDADMERAEGSMDGITVAGVGFSTPESVLHDAVADVYLVSNISGVPIDKDGDGFISRVTPDGVVEELKWIDGAAGDFELNAPKGMAILGDSLFVADIDCVRIFHRVTGESAGEVCFPDATFLNDVAVDDNGTFYVTDSGLQGADFSPSGTDAVYRFTLDGRRAALLSGDELGRPNGIAFGPRGGFVVTFGTGEIFQLTPDGSRNTVLPGDGARQLDGIVFTPDGGFLFSSWGNQTVHQITPDGNLRNLVEGVTAPADIGLDIPRNRVLIPLFQDNELWIREIG